MYNDALTYAELLTDSATDDKLDGLAFESESYSVLVLDEME